VLHTQAFKDISVREIMDFNEYMFLNQEFSGRGERVIAQELNTRSLMVKVLFAPDKIPNQLVAEALAKYGCVTKFDHEMFRD
jgi:hypothetical protein